MKRFVQETPRLAAGFFAFLLGIVLLVPAYIGINQWTGPRTAKDGTWEDFLSDNQIQAVVAIRVYEEQNLFQYSTGPDRWVNVPKDRHLMKGYKHVSYPAEQKERLTILAAVLLLAVGPLLAASTKVPSLASATTQKQMATTGGVQPAPKAPQQTPEPSQKPVKKPQAPAPVDDVAAAKIKVEAFKDASVTFDDIAGYQTTKENMQFIVHCLSRPELLEQTGAKVPSGILLYGPPGTGKTLLARAIAGSANVGFFPGNASDFVNKWVGTGAENIRALYKEARAHAPSIVFIDEIDAIGGQRTSEMNNEYRQTLNALLSEMDGLNKDDGVLTIAATNSFDSLDTALVRAGRFDRKIMVPLPSYEDRLAIIQLYAKKRNLSAEVSLETIAKNTVGMSGSELSTLFNEASLMAVQSNRGVVLPEDMDGAITRMLTNGEASRASNKKDLEVAAYHEAGHAIVLKLLAKNRIPKVSIIGTTSGCVGLTVQIEGEERQLMPVQQIRALIMGSYGGRAAEELIYGKDAVTTGARQDIRYASGLIREYLQQGAGASLLDAEAFTGQGGMMDMAEAKALSAELYAATMEFLSGHRDLLEKLAQALLEKETLTEEELDKFF